MLCQNEWDPSLAFVMMGAIGVAMPAFARLRAWKATGRGPVLPCETNRVPDPSTKVDLQLLTGEFFMFIVIFNGNIITTPWLW